VHCQPCNAEPEIALCGLVPLLTNLALFNRQSYCEVSHWHIWSINTGGGGSAKSTRVLGGKSRNQVRKKGKIGLNQSLIYIHPFLHSDPN
jgi:hypothetical protein